MSPLIKRSGEMALLGDTVRSATATATVKTETLSINRESFDILMDTAVGLRDRMEKIAEERNRQNVAKQSRAADSSDLVSFLMGQGLGEATDVLLIDEEKCVACDFANKRVPPPTTAHLDSTERPGQLTLTSIFRPLAGTARIPAA